MKTRVLPLAALVIAVALLPAAPRGHAQPPAAAPATATAVLRADRPGAVVNKNIYGHFAEHLGRGIYEGIWVGPDSEVPNTRGIRNDVVAALRELSIPVLRWPGGCFADEYHWKDGIGPREKRPSMINTHWGGVVEDNRFGTHEFMDLVEQLGTDAYITGNVGSGTAQEMMEWVEYLTSDAVSPMANLRRQNGREKAWRLPYFGIANEPWGCGGNMRPEYYADEYRKYNTFVKDYDRAKPIYRIAAGANAEDYRWTEVLMSVAGRRMDGLSLHYYTLPTGNWGAKGSATRFDEALWFSTLQRTLRMDELIARHDAVMDEAEAEWKAASRGGLAASAVSGQTPPAGPQWVSGLQPLEPHPLAYDKPLCASLDGFTLHAATRAGALHPGGREALLRYVLRPPIAQERLEPRPDGLVRITLKKAYTDGTVAVDMDPLSLLCRLATSVPPPRFHTVRYAVVPARG